MRIGEMLVRMGVLNREQVGQILDEQQSTNEPFGTIAERLFQVGPDTIEQAWIEQTQERATMFDPERGIEDDARELVVRRQAWQFGIVPLRLDDGYLIAATSRKQLPRAVRFATRVLGMPVQFEIADDEELSQLLAHQYPIRGMDRRLFEGTAFANLFGRKAA
jgi:Type II secretion system (T2SS), protein E, N-terminal domain